MGETLEADILIRLAQHRDRVGQLETALAEAIRAIENERAAHKVTVEFYNAARADLAALTAELAEERRRRGGGER